RSGRRRGRSPLRTNTGWRLPSRTRYSRGCWRTMPVRPWRRRPWQCLPSLSAWTGTSRARTTGCAGASGRLPADRLTRCTPRGTLLVARPPGLETRGPTLRHGENRRGTPKRSETTGEPVEVPEGLTLIGRDGDCDVQLSWAFVSKMHCVLANMDGCLLVRD